MTAGGFCLVQSIDVQVQLKVARGFNEQGEIFVAFEYYMMCFQRKVHKNYFIYACHCFAGMIKTKCKLEADLMSFSVADASLQKSGELMANTSQIFIYLFFISLYFLLNKL